MADATGALTITAGQNNYWTAVSYNNLQIWFGGAPNPPFKYSGSGNASALGGTPPSAKTAFVANNRVFAISTSADPSILQWCVLSNPEDWTGTGSGSTLVSKNDGQELLFGVPLGADAAILFKNSSTHLVPLTKSPFPVYQLQNKVGACGRYAWVMVDGVIYFITPSLRMKATTDGVNFVDFPAFVDDLWDTVNSTRMTNIVGIYYPALTQIHWICSVGAGTTNSISIIWDLMRKAWLYHPSGFKSNVAALRANRTLYTGHYNGKIYEQDVVGVYTDDSESSPFAIDAYWQTPWFRLSTFDGKIWPYWIDIMALTEDETNITISYGFDFNTDQKNGDVSLASSGGMMWDQDNWDEGFWSGQSSVRRRLFTFGNGENVSFKIRNNQPDEGFTIEGIAARCGSDKPGKIVTMRQ
jgi:hypothetical protein